jgi:hypothetical protein
MDDSVARISGMIDCTSDVISYLRGAALAWLWTFLKLHGDKPLKILLKLQRNSCPDVEISVTVLETADHIVSTLTYGKA